MLASGSGLQLQPNVRIVPGTQYAIIGCFPQKSSQKPFNLADGPGGTSNLIFLNPQTMSLGLDSQNVAHQQFLGQPNVRPPQQQQQRPPTVTTKIEPGTQVPQLDGGPLAYEDEDCPPKEGRGKTASSKGKKKSAPEAGQKISLQKERKRAKKVCAEREGSALSLPTLNLF